MKGEKGLDRKKNRDKEGKERGKPNFGGGGGPKTRGKDTARDPKPGKAILKNTKKKRETKTFRNKIA